VQTPRPLDGATIVITRASDGADALRAPLEALGARVIVLAATRIVPRNLEQLDGQLSQIEHYHWVVCTSPTAVRLLFERAAVLDVTATLATRQFAVIGTGTAHALARHGAVAAVVPTAHVAESLVAALGARHDVEGTRVLYPVAVGARDLVADALQEQGAGVARIEIYESEVHAADAGPVLDALKHGRVTAVVLLAPSAVRGWLAAVGAQAPLAPVVSMGPITSDAARAAGLWVATEASPSTLDGVVQAVVRYWRTDADARPDSPSAR
jgi:uroporphyrinogen-III synthase